MEKILKRGGCTNNFAANCIISLVRYRRVPVSSTRNLAQLGRARDNRLCMKAGTP